MALIYQIEMRSDTAANWTAADTLLGTGEVGFETDSGKFKIGQSSLAWNSLPYATSAAGGLVLNASRGTPNLITAGGGITPTTSQRELQFIAGNAAPVTITAPRPIGAGTTPGQELILMGADATNTVTFSSGTGVFLNGTIVMGSAIASGGAGSVLYLVWDGTSWNEVSRR